MRAFLYLCTIFLLTSCSDTPWVRAARYELRSLTPYENTLRMGYVEIAQREAKRNDWEDAYYFGNKALAVINEGSSEPQNPNERALRPEDKLYFNMAYHFLLKLKSVENGEYSLELATAQVQYDCWLEEQEEYLTDHEGAIECYDKFTSLITEIADAAAEEESTPIRYDVYYLMQHKGSEKAL